MKLLFVLGLCVASAFAGEGPPEGYGADPAPPAPPEPEPYADPMAEAASMMEEMEAELPMEEPAPEEPAPEEPAPEEPAPEEAPAEEPAPEEAPAEEPAPEEPAPEEPAPEEPAPEEEAAPAADVPAPEPADGYGDEPPPPPPPPATEAPATEAPATEAPAPATEAPSGYSDVAPATDAPAPEPEPEPMDGYRASLKGARKRVISWAAVKESDMFLVLDPTCKDNHAQCSWFASIRRGTIHPVFKTRVQKSECFRNKFLLKREGCPLSCGVCTPSRRDWAVRRRLAMRKRALRLKNKNKN